MGTKIFRVVDNIKHRWASFRGKGSPNRLEIQRGEALHVRCGGMGPFRVSRLEMNIVGIFRVNYSLTT